MTKVPRHEILLALLTSFVNNVANIPRCARLASLTNHICCVPATLAVLVRGLSPMSLQTKTFNLFFAALLAIAWAGGAQAQNNPTTGLQSMPGIVDDPNSISTRYDWYGESHPSVVPSRQQKRSLAPPVGQRVQGPGYAETDLPEPKRYREKADPGMSPTVMQHKGFVRPDGYYEWGPVDQYPMYTGYVQPTFYGQPGHTDPFKSKDAAFGPVKDYMLDIVDTSHRKRGTFVTTWEMAAIMSAAEVMKADLEGDPSTWKPAMETAQMAKQSAAANTEAGKAEANQNTGWENTAFYPLINIANEEAWEPCAADAAFKTYQNAAWMVGQMYKQVYIPMAILFLLPGAVLTQVKVVVRTGFLFGGNDEDTVSPFSGIMRSMIAIFLIPATQLFMSYCIDVGNSLTYEVVNFKPWFDLRRIEDWRNEQTYDVKKKNYLNYIPKVPEQAFNGKLEITPEKNTKFEKQHNMDISGQQWFNTLGNLLGQGMICLNAFQFVMVLYLFLLGPIAGALFAWPGVARETFKKVFANWMNGVVLVTLWKFWWCIILLAMSIRLYLYQDAFGRLPPPEDPFEMFMAAAFGAMLMYIPFNPFDFRPGDLVSSVLEKAQQQSSKGGSGAASVGSAGGAGSGGGGGGGNSGSGPGMGGE